MLYKSLKSAIKMYGHQRLKRFICSFYMHFLCSMQSIKSDFYIFHWKSPAYFAISCDHCKFFSFLDANMVNAQRLLKYRMISLHLISRQKTYVCGKCSIWNKEKNEWNAFRGNAWPMCLWLVFNSCNSNGIPQHQTLHF